MIIVGINAFHPDSSVAILKDGKLIWAGEEERFSRIKHASGFPDLALKHAFIETELIPSKIDIVAISRNPKAQFVRKIVYALSRFPQSTLIADRLRALKSLTNIKQYYNKALDLNILNLKTKFIYVEHHRAHLASAFYLSGFEKSALLSIDGMGDFSSAAWGLGDEKNINIQGRVCFPHSLGFLYSAGTQFLGFPHFGDEYKVMGLAAYGEPVFLNTFRKMIRLKTDGRFELKLKYFLHHRGNAKVRWEGGFPEQDILYSSEWEKEFGSPRPASSDISKKHYDIAASLQAALEETYFHILNSLYKKTKCENLCLAGGVAFNGVANGKISSQTSFKKIFIQPAAGDAGTAIGSAYAAYYGSANMRKNCEMKTVSYGSEWEAEDIREALSKSKVPYRKVSKNELIERTVNSIIEGKIVGWFQGRMEFGPRALGNRSILANPENSGMKDILNERIKNREGFRPFAPAVPKERAHEFFDMDCEESPFMLKVFRVKADKKHLIPAVTHVDGTARVQTVDKDVHPLFWQLLTAFGTKTGIPVLLNTSFNENEPIVRTPSEAVQCFLKTKMDELVIGDFMITKPDKKR